MNVKASLRQISPWATAEVIPVQGLIGLEAPIVGNPHQRFLGLNLLKSGVVRHQAPKDKVNFFQPDGLCFMITFPIGVHPLFGIIS